MSRSGRDWDCRGRVPKLALGSRHGLHDNAGGGLVWNLSELCLAQPAIALRPRKLNEQILITCGAGYVAAVVSEELLKAGHVVVVYDNFSQGHREAVHPDAPRIEGDLRDLDSQRIREELGWKPRLPEA